MRAKDHSEMCFEMSGNVSNFPGLLLGVQRLLNVEVEDRGKLVGLVGFGSFQSSGKMEEDKKEPGF